VVKHAPELEIGDAPLDAADVAFDGAQRGVVGFGARELVELLAVVELAPQLGQCQDDTVELLLLLAELLRARRIVPDLRVLELAIDGGETCALDVEVKDTSAAGRSARADPRSRSRSR
jgi:hypothetical protein